jgi:hypothetical protein
MLKTDARLKRCGGEVRFQLPPDSNHAKAHPTPSLIRAVARAHDWVDRILRGESTNQRTLVEATGLDERYVGRILPLAFGHPTLPRRFLKASMLRTCHLRIFAAMCRSIGMSNELSSVAVSRCERSFGILFDGGSSSYSSPHFQ